MTNKGTPIRPWFILLLQIKAFFIGFRPKHAFSQVETLTDVLAFPRFHWLPLYVDYVYIGLFNGRTGERVHLYVKPGHVEDVKRRLEEWDERRRAAVAERLAKRKV